MRKVTVTELKVAGEDEGLVRGNVALVLEQHHRDRFAGESILNDELRDNVEPHLLVRDSLGQPIGEQAISDRTKSSEQVQRTNDQS